MYADGKFEGYLKYKYLDSALTDHIKNSKINSLKVLITFKNHFSEFILKNHPPKNLVLSNIKKKNEEAVQLYQHNQISTLEADIDDYYSKKLIKKNNFKASPDKNREVFHK